MKRNPSLLRLVVLAMLVAVGVVISPILRVEGMCPTAHLINIVCAVLLGPVYSFVCACTIGVIRMSLMGIPPLALTGAVFGAALSGILYRLSGGRLIFAVIGEVVGTGIIGAVASYPVMTLWWGYTGLTWVYYVPSFIAGTLIGGSVAFLLLKKLAKNGMLLKMQQELETKTTAILDLELTKNAQGETTVTGVSYTPYYMIHRDGAPVGQRRYLVNIHEAMAEYEAGTSSIVSASAYQELQDALAHCHQILGSADDSTLS